MSAASATLTSMVRANLPWSSNTAIVASGSVVTVSSPNMLSTLRVSG
jgi:hypothetical protein